MVLVVACPARQTRLHLVAATSGTRALIFRWSQGEGPGSHAGCIGNAAIPNTSILKCEHYLFQFFAGTTGGFAAILFSFALISAGAGASLSVILGSAPA